MAFTAQDKQFMQRALTLARRALGKTSPNPCVGAVLVKNSRVIAEDYHKHAGGPHAEVFVFRKAGKRARGATLYVTLEPCCTWGRTPPCTDAIIAAGVKRVIVATTDPNPRHAGRGFKILRRAGIRVDAGLLANESTALNAPFNKWITTGMPLVIAKVAASLDGKIATRTGDSQWITSEAARREAHKLRARVDAVMVTAGTVRRDDPRLTLRHGVRGNQPRRVVVDARGRSPLRAKLFTDKFRKRTVVVTTAMSSQRWRQSLEKAGVGVITVKHDGDHVNLPAMLKAVGKLGVTSVMIEGGSDFLAALLEERLVDRVAFFYAPVIIGGREAVPAVGGRGIKLVGEAIRLNGCRFRTLAGECVMVTGEICGVRRVPAVLSGRSASSKRRGDAPQSKGRR